MLLPSLQEKLVKKRDYRVTVPYDVWSRLVAGNEPVVDVEAEEGRREHQHRDGIQHAGVLQQPRQPAL